MTKKTLFVIVTLFVSFITIQAQNWVQIGADIDGKAANHQSGYSVSLSTDGSVVAIGAIWNGGDNNKAGYVRVFKNQGGTWTQVGEDIDGENDFDKSGCAVSLSADGSIVAIGAFNNSGNGTSAGHVRVYRNQNDTWTKIGLDIDGEAAGNYSGCSVSLSSDGSVVAIGAEGNNESGSYAGHVRVYRNQNGTWTKIGADIDGEAANDYSGCAVSLSSDGSVVAIGAEGNNGNGTSAGHVRTFKNQYGTWMQIGTDIDGEAEGDNSGCSVSLSANGSVMAIGAINNDGNGNNAGQVRVYINLNGLWSQVGDDIDGEANSDNSGKSVSLSADGSVLAIGAPYNKANGYSYGHVRVYKNISSTWTQLGKDIDAESLGSEAGYSVNLNSDGSIVAIGAPNNDGNGSNAGHVRVYRLAPKPIITSQPANQENICPASNISYKITALNIDNYQWQVNKGSGFEDIANSGVYSNATTATLNIRGVTLDMNNYQYRCYVTNVVGSDTSNIAIFTIDKKNPEIICTTNHTVNADQTHYFVVNGTIFDPISTIDNCGVATITNSINGTATLADASFAEGQTYTITWTVTDILGNANTCNFNVTVKNYVGIEVLQLNGISIFPKPTNGLLNLDFAHNIIQKIIITNITGKQIIEKINIQQNEQIDLSNFESGIYIIKIQTDKDVFTTKIIKE